MKNICSPGDFYRQCLYDIINNKYLESIDNFSFEITGENMDIVEQKLNRFLYPLGFEATYDLSYVNKISKLCHIWEFRNLKNITLNMYPNLHMEKTEDEEHNDMFYNQMCKFSSTDESLLIDVFYTVYTIDQYADEENRIKENPKKKVTVTVTNATNLNVDGIYPLIYNALSVGGNFQILDTADIEI